MPSKWEKNERTLDKVILYEIDDTWHFFKTLVVAVLQVSHLYSSFKDQDRIKVILNIYSFLISFSDTN